MSSFMSSLSIITILCLIPVVCGSVYACLCLAAILRLRSRSLTVGQNTFSQWPPVTILKPICGLEKNLRTNLRTTCEQTYPVFQIVLSVQDPNDAAIPLLYEIQREYGRKRVTVAIENCAVGPNGKINNLIGGLKHARHDILVISDSDVQLRPDYLTTIVGPLANPEVGYVCTLYKAAQAKTWVEKMELLTINTELTPNMMFALVTGTSKFCLGASTALRRSTLTEIGGLESLVDYLVEDYEMGRRIWTTGQRMVVLPYLVDTIVDLRTPLQWWNHLIYWDQNQRAARPWAFFATVLIKPIPFACLFVLLTLGSPMSLYLLALTVTIRLTTVGMSLKWGLQDREGFRSLWLVPFRDIAALGSWVLAFTQRTTVWRHGTFTLTADGRLLAQEATTCDPSSLPETTSASPSR
ncbi:MAG: bacteriohopanetetrol glucosamine biosynthesis glycosyltransferase HpnI [Nitrospirales bacterium]|nr:bacteriohopanetetrol glucosamine biosynthesis glycosyltransferase HpnI [Nitrospirales bacterium]